MRPFVYTAVAEEGNDLKDEVSQRFGSCKYLLVVNMSDLSVNAIQNKRSLGEELAQKVIDFGCEAVITGELNSAEKALELMEKRLLKLIRNHEETKGCDGNHHKH
jgi:predicted Fe-Mo cluster-binding NifX family protein